MGKTSGAEINTEERNIGKKFKSGALKSVPK